MGERCQLNVERRNPTHSPGFAEASTQTVPRHGMPHEGLPSTAGRQATQAGLLPGTVSVVFSSALVGTKHSEDWQGRRQGKVITVRWADRGACTSIVP